MKNYILSLLIVLLPTVLVGQNIIYKNETKRNSIPLRRNHAVTETFLNDILDTLKGPNQTRSRGLVFYYDKNVEIARKKNDLHFRVSFADIRYRGNTLYRNFETSDVLIPNKVSYIIDWYDGNNTRLKSIPIEKADVDTETLALEEFVQLDSLKKEAYTAKTKGFVFHFDEFNWAAFKSRIDIIDEFYRDYDSAVYKIKQIRSGRFKTEANSPELPIASQFVNATKNFVKTVRDKNFESIKIGEGKRIPDLYIQVEDLEQLNANLYNKVQVSIKGKSSSIIANVEKRINSQDYDGAEKVITQELFHLGLYGVGNYYLADISYKKKEYRRAMNKMLVMSNKYAFDTDLAAKFDKMIMKLDRVFLDTVVHLTSQSKFEESLDILNDVYTLTGSSKTVLDLIAYNSLVKKNLKKVLLAYAEHGKSKFTAGDFQSAILWFQNSTTICERFNMNVCDEQLESKMTESKIEYQNKLATSISHSIANYELEKAAERIEEEVLFRSDNKLKEHPLVEAYCLQLQNKYYIRALKMANVSYHKRNFGEAIDYYFEAKKIAIESDIDQPEVLDSLVLYTAQIYYSNFTADSVAFINKITPNDIQLALLRMDKLKGLLDKERSEELAARRKFILSLEADACDKIKRDYDSLLILAEKQQRSASFRIADSLLQQAISLAFDYESCEITIDKALTIKQEIAHGVGYELTLKHIMETIKSSFFGDAIDQYHNLTEYYNIYQLDKLGLQHKSLQNFIAETGDVHFINFCIGQFSDMDNSETALFLLNNLYHRGINKNEAKNGQIALGLILAAKDFQDNSGRPLKEMIRRYTNGDEWFQHFEQVYSMRWEMLQDNK